MKLVRFRTLSNAINRIDRRSLNLANISLCFIVKSLQLLPSFKRGRILKDLLYANDFQVTEVHENLGLPNLELLYVATLKDFEVLNSTISTTIKSLSNYRILRISIIVPEKHLEVLKNSLPELSVPIDLISENSLIADLDIQELKTIFLDRYGWVLQQLLKILYVSHSESDGVLVVDADTALLCQRNWLDLSGNQILTPSWEYHEPYYKFLKERRVGKYPPDFTFVSHHMLFQPHIMREILDTLGWGETKTIIKELISSARDHENSPFSIDYELYAQFLYSSYPEKITLEKWGNFESAGKLKNGNFGESIQEIIAGAHGKFASVSFHSYLN